MKRKRQLVKPSMARVSTEIKKGSIMSGQEVPFKVSEEVEARSFLQGYRGAWFRCKIRKFSSRDDQKWCSLKYFDFPDQKLVSTKLYQFPPIHNRKSKKKKMELMIRPRFPPIHRESQVPDVNTISEVMVIVNDDWKVGDLVDWWADNNSYWSGRITQILGDDKVQIELHPPPVGEGLSYEVPCNDLRPSLDWSPQHGWTVVTPKGTDGQCCARILKPVNQGARLSSTTDVEAVAGASHVTPTSASSSQPSDKIGQMKKQPPKGAVEAKEASSSQPSDKIGQMKKQPPKGAVEAKEASSSQPSDKIGQMKKQPPKGAVEAKEASSSQPSDKIGQMKKQPPKGAVEAKEASSSQPSDKIGQMKKQPPKGAVEAKEIQSSRKNMADSRQMEKRPTKGAVKEKEMQSSGINMEDSNMVDSGQMEKQPPEDVVEPKEMHMEDSKMEDSGQMEKQPPEDVVEPKEKQSSGANIDSNKANSGQTEKQPPKGAMEAKEMPSSGTNMADSGVEKTSGLDNLASSIIKDATSEGDVAMLDKIQHDKLGSLKKMIIDEETSSDTTEAVILKVEELVNKIKWMKNLLDIRKPLTKPQWKLVHQALSPPK